MGNARDLTGQRFGRLVVIGPAEPKMEGGQRRRMWECRCDCGNIRITKGSNLMAGNSKSCGCIMREHMGKVNKQNAEMIGKKYGELTIIGHAERPEGPEGLRYKRSNWYLCRCSCGREVVMAAQYVSESKRPHCGCKQREVKKASRKIGHDGSYVKLERVDGTLQAKGVDGALVGLIRNDRDCAQCGKTFDMYAGNKWAWRKQFGGKILVFCSYGCIRKHDEEHRQRFTTVKY